jgi:hypothetical protein
MPRYFEYFVILVLNKILVACIITVGVENQNSSEYVTECRIKEASFRCCMEQYYG